jgi:hypothetical protein
MTVAEQYEDWRRKGFLLPVRDGPWPPWDELEPGWQLAFLFVLAERVPATVPV